jgi:methionyl-tRNA formyltransferase
MNIVFFGSSHFAVPSLEALVKRGHKVLSVVTQPDRKKGRGLHLESTAVKLVASRADLKVVQPQNVNTAETARFLKSQNADLFVVISYGQIVSQEVLDIPKIFPINAHASLLPFYRGAAPINWALINGEKATGVTIMKMEKKMDAGPILMQQSLNILEEDTAVSLEQRLSKLAAELLITSLESIGHGKYDLILQKESEVTFAPKLKKEDGRIHWELPAQKVRDLIRGCLEWPGAFTHYKSKFLKIFKGKVASSFETGGECQQGKIVAISKQGITVVTGKGGLVIEELQMEGKKVMTVREFIAGHKMRVGEIFE